MADQVDATPAPAPAAGAGAGEAVERLLRIMASLRDPQAGCPWDLQQNFETIAPYTIEEAYEVADAIARGDLAQLADELGDLLFQVVFHARLGEEQGAFDFADVVAAIIAKMVRRHPHVFGGAAREDAPAQARRWEAIKEAERQARGEPVRHGALDGVGRGLPPLQRAATLQRRAARQGFDWPEVGGVLDKLREEAGELSIAVGARDALAMQVELGDLLFTCVNLARHLRVDAEVALSAANARFETRYRVLETLAGGRDAVAALSAAEREVLWQRAKLAEE